MNSAESHASGADNPENKPLFQMSRGLIGMGQEITLKDASFRLEVAGYQRRFHCPVEGASIWMHCDPENARIIVRNRSAGWEVREVFAVHDLEPYSEKTE